MKLVYENNMNRLNFWGQLIINALALPVYGMSIGILVSNWPIQVGLNYLFINYLGFHVLLPVRSNRSATVTLPGLPWFTASTTTSSAQQNMKGQHRPVY